MTSIIEIAGTASRGTLYGIGVGPGDVRYLTLRAAGLITSVDVIAYFAKRGRPGNARTIIAPLMAQGREEWRLEYPVTDEIPVEDPSYQSQISTFYEEIGAQMRSRLRQGRSIGLIAEGDPFFYGSFMHMWRRLADDVAVEVVPGVTGMAGCWTKANAPITWGDDVLTVLPGTLSQAQLTERLANTDAAVIMKLGRNLPKVIRAVAAAGLYERAIYVERGTMPGEIVLPLRELGERSAPYFSMILVPGEGRRL